MRMNVHADFNQVIYVEYSYIYIYIHIRNMVNRI